MVVFDRNEDGAKQVAGEIGGDFVAGDVTDPEDCQRAVDLAAEAGDAAHRGQLRRHRTGPGGSSTGTAPRMTRAHSSSSCG